MKSLTAFASAAVLAATLAVAAAPAHAAPVFAQWTPDAAAADYKWIHNGTGGELISINSGSDTTAQGVASHFSFLDPAYAQVLSGLAATFTLDATAASGNSANQAGPLSGNTYTQTGLDGSFSFIYAGPTQTIGSFNLVNGVTNLLSGAFTDAWIQGNGGSGSYNLAIGNGGHVTFFHSDVVNFAHSYEREFAANILNISPHLTAPGCGNALHAGPCTGTGSLNTFTANGGGNFSAAGIPEPATWGLMIVGFGGLGLVLRNNRRRAIATA